jgi:hypothetical protein
MAKVLQHGAAAQFAGISGAGTGDVDCDGVGREHDSSFACRILNKAGCGRSVQALPMNSLRSAWTPVLAGFKPPNKQAKEKSEADTDELYSLSD